MLIVPLIFSCLIAGVTSTSNLQLLGRIAVKTIAIFLVTTALSISIGLLVSTLMQPGLGVRLPLPPEDAATFSQTPALAEILVNLVPANPIKAMAEGNILQVIVFALLLGIAINATGKKALLLRWGFEALSEVMYKLTDIIMHFAPYGIFALISIHRYPGFHWHRRSPWGWIDYAVAGVNLSELAARRISDSSRN